MSASLNRCVRAACFGAGVAWPSVAALAADDVATLAFNNRTWGNPTAWTHSNPAANGTVPNNSREFDYDVVVARTVDLDLDVTVEKGLLDGGQISDAAASPNTLRFNDVFTFRNGFLQPNTTAAGGIVFDNATGNPFIERANLLLPGPAAGGAGVATWTGGNVSPIAGGGLTNSAGAKFHVQAASNLAYFSNDLTGFWNNQGQVIKTGAARWDVRANFFNFGTGELNVNEGEVRLLSGGTSSGRFNLAPNTRLVVTGSTYVLGDNARVEGEGLMQIGTSGRLRVGEPGQPAVDAVIAHVQIAGLLSIVGSSRLHILNRLELLGEIAGEINGGIDEKLIIEQAAQLHILLAAAPLLVRDATINNRGTTTIEGGGTNSLALQNGARLRNASTGVLNVNAPATLVTTTTADPGAIVNDGTACFFTAPTGQRVTLIGVDVTNRGDLTCKLGVVMDLIDATYTQTAGQTCIEDDATMQILNGLFRLTGGGVCGLGEIVARVEVTSPTVSRGRISPGVPAPRFGGRGSTTGKLTIRGELVMGDGAELFTELGGRTQSAQYDLLDVVGTAALDGDLLIDLIDGFEFSILPTDVFTVLTADAPLTGAFDNVASGGRVTGVDGFATFQVNYGPGSPFDPNSVVVSNVAFVPEPGAGVLTCVAAALLTRRRRVA